VTTPADLALGGAHATLVRLVRDEGPRVLASLVRTTGSLQLAEDAVQDAVVRALELWPREGVPAEPRGWLTLTARRRAVDLIRREAKRLGKETAAAEALELVDEPLPDEAAIRDDLLRLLFTCCHPSLPTEAQTALALRTLCGLTTAEVARALLVSEATMAKRLTRARGKIAAAKIPCRTPPAGEWPQRLHGVLTTVYLLFNEGYSATGGDDPLRQALTSEALRLAALLHELLPDEVGVVGLRALLLLQDARRAARLDAAGDLVRLADQDRTLWDRDAIADGMALLGIALRRPSPTPDPYVAQAAIAACHVLAPTWGETNWAAIVSWYDALLMSMDTPVVRLNRAVAVGELRGPLEGLAKLEPVTGMEDYLPLEVARGEFLARLGRIEEARAAFRRAMALPGNAAAKRELARRLDELL